MKCPKCGYTGFPYAGSCGNCGRPLADARELYGVYAVPPTNPPDLLLAYEPAQTASSDLAPWEATSSPAIDLGQLHDLDLALASSDEAAPGAIEGQAPLLDLDTPPTTPDATRVFELDLADEHASLSLTPVQEGPSGRDEDAQATEYILEIDEELELEVEELALEDEPHEDSDEDQGHDRR